MENHIAGYLREVQELLGLVPAAPVTAIMRALNRARQEGRTVFLIGNGGSAALASHLATDLSKLPVRPGLPRMRALGLAANIPLLTAWANDTAYENVFSEQLENLMRPGDVLVAISGSGCSPNIIKAVQCARELGGLTIGLTGFDGGRLKDTAELCLIVPSDSMQQVEDAHLVLAHAIMTGLRKMGEEAAPAPSRTRAVFIDRDGVINENRADYVKSWSEFRFIDGSLEALARLAATEFHVVIASNQSAIGRGLATQESVEEIHRLMTAEIERAGGRVTQVLYCPHPPEARCACRKPRAGMLLRACSDLGLDLARSYMIGDALSDIRAGAAVGCTTVLVGTGLGAEAQAQLDELDALDGSRPRVVPDLAAAVNWILEREAGAGRG